MVYASNLIEALNGTINKLNKTVESIDNNHSSKKVWYFLKNWSQQKPKNHQIQYNQYQFIENDVQLWFLEQNFKQKNIWYCVCFPIVYLKMFCCVEHVFTC